MERLLAGLVGPGHPESAIDQAQDIMYDAWGAAKAKERVRLAHKALEVSPLCADAYVLLAEHAKPGSDEVIELLRKGVEAGELALGKEFFEEEAGYFWGILETRPYMRARCGLAQVLWARGDHGEAIAHYRDLLRLNPNDNQGIRYLLAAWNLELGLEEDLAALLKDYEEDGSPAWTYTRALVAFRCDGDCESSRTLLAEGFTSNLHVPNYLLGKRRMPKRIPAFIMMGGKDEAVSYVFEYGISWAKTPGALAWLETARARSAASA